MTQQGIGRLLVLRSLILNFLICFVFPIPAFCGVSFDNSDDAIEVTNLTGYYDQTTWALWVKPGGFGESSLGRFFEKRKSSGQSVLLYIDGANKKICFDRVWNSVSEWCTPNDSWGTDKNGVWGFVVVTYDQTSTSNDPIIYINGVSQSLTETVSPSGSLTNTADPYVIGNRLNDTARTFYGVISEFYVWGTILTQSDIDILYKSKIKGMGLQISPTNLKTSLSLSDKTGGISTDGIEFYDQSGNNNYGVGNDGADNTGLTAVSEEVLTYP